MSRAKDLIASTRLVSDIAADTKEELYRLFERNYDNVSRVAFRRDLQEKQWIILLEDTRAGKIVGFSTLMLIDGIVDSVPILAAFSGDTIIDRDYWGGQRLVKSWYQIMESIRIQYPTKNLYWFLISKGYRTYLYLPTFFKEFYPRFNRPTPPFERKIIDTIGCHKYPQYFNPDTGVIEFPRLEGNLNADLAQVPSHRKKDPNVRFFLDRNPGYARGNELVCVAKFAPENLMPFGLRLAAEWQAKQAR